MSVFVGIDVSKATLDVAIRHETDCSHFQVKNTPSGFRQLQRRLPPHDQITRIALEASGRYGEPLALWLVEHLYPVSYLNPKLTYRFAQTHLRYNKTDAHDALVIAHYAQLYLPDLWQAPTHAQRLLSQRSRRLDTLKKERRRETNRLKSGITDDFVLQQIQAHILYFDQLIDATRKAIRQIFRQDSNLKHSYRLLTSIPGIGEVTATLFLAEVRHASRFQNVKQLTAFFGLDPQDWQSGTSVSRPAHISKHGHSHLRAALYMPALTAMKHNTACRNLNLRLHAKHKPGKVRVVAVMRKLLHQIFGVLKHQTPFDDHYEFRQQFS